MYVIQFNPPLPDPNKIETVKLTITVGTAAPLVQNLSPSVLHSGNFDGIPGQHVHAEAVYHGWDGKDSPTVTVFDGVLPDAAGNATPNVPPLGPVTFAI